MPASRNICVFCGSSAGANPEYGRLAQELGTALNERQLGLVYGGGNVGLMGRLADATRAAGAPVIGVIPEALQKREFAHGGLDKLLVVSDMHERKATMAAHSCAFLVLPGGFGTLEELFEVIAWSQLGLHKKKLGLLNIRGYFDYLLAFLDHSVEERFLKPDHRALIIVADRIDPLLDAVLSESD